MSAGKNERTRLTPGKRAEMDTRPRGKKEGAGSFWAGEEARKWYILLCLSGIIALLLFPNILTRPATYKLGDVAARDIKASQEFLVENRELTDKDRTEAVRGVLTVYDFDPTANNVVGRIREAFRAGREGTLVSMSTDGVPAQSASPLDRKEETAGTVLDRVREDFFEILDVPPDTAVFDTLARTGFPVDAEEDVVQRVTQVLGQGVVNDKAMLISRGEKGVILLDIHSEKEMVVSDLDRFYGLGEARKFILAQEPTGGHGSRAGEAAGSSLKLAAMIIKPNVTFNKRETEFRKALARESVRPVYFKVKKGEMLVREGERIARDHLVKLTEHNKFLRKKEMIGRIPAMAVMIGLLISALYMVGLMTTRSSKTGVRDLLFSAVTLLAVFLMVMAGNFVAEEVARGFTYFTPRALLFAMPVAGGAMLIAIFQRIGVAASFSLMVSVLAALVVGGQVEFFIYFFISSLIAAHGVQNCRERGVFIKTGLRVGLVNMILALAIEAIHGSFYTVESSIALASAFIGGILVGVIATGFLPLIEMAFGYTSDIKLLELANLDQPLLKELMLRAPGSHHHSVIVSNMVEACAEPINANPLLAKVAAYYHDIGKMRKPLYFIENQMGGENKHERLAPSMSGLILISHVKNGVELAKTQKLGRDIIDIIQQHHGTSLIRYFYEKAKAQEEKKGGKLGKVNEEAFRYPGPKPQTKEAGLVMLADFVEAASRSLVEPTAARIKGMVQKIINRVFSDGQLDECELTLKDLDAIAKSFNKTLSGIFHHRIEYPESVVKTASGRNKKGENGNTDPLPQGDAVAGKSEDKAEAEESLRRLGTTRQ